MLDCGFGLLKFIRPTQAGMLVAIFTMRRCPLLIAAFIFTNSGVFRIKNLEHDSAIVYATWSCAITTLLMESIRLVGHV
jgi:hypothetical protein